ncbi:MAG TPA: Na+/H+ antiporter subunit B [Candidatus Binatia bacterium]|nr:Na+/H+ antiporter subunit B [Candidatus Binatia bacterium]
MRSIILQTATRLILTLLLLFSIFLLLRGHNEPGGGFIAGLVAAGAFVLYAIAYDVKAAQQALGFEPHLFIAAGLLLAVLSGLMTLFTGEPFLTGQWVSWKIGESDSIDLGTPLLFDVGVYVVVIGVTLTIILTLAEE